MNLSTYFHRALWVATSHYLPRVSDDVSEGATLQELHHYPEFITHQEAVIHVHYVRVMIVPHDDHLGIVTSSTVCQCLR